ncbi:MAG: hypothetical protein COB30_004470 [Ectothiorhodospiraceae bacterium]|nr:hypothetical protein [Ectothiorhodospiraceae bacterium]
MNLNNGVDIYLSQSTKEILFLRRRDEMYLVLSGDYEAKDIGHLAMSAIDSKLFDDFEWNTTDENFYIDWDDVLCASTWRGSGSLVVTSPVYVANIEEHPQIKLANNPKHSELGEAILGRFAYCKQMQVKNA